MAKTKPHAELTAAYRRKPWGYAGMAVRFVRTCTFYALSGNQSRRVREHWAMRSARGVVATGDRMALWGIAEAEGWRVTDHGLGK